MTVERTKKIERPEREKSGFLARTRLGLDVILVKAEWRKVSPVYVACGTKHRSLLLFRCQNSIPQISYIALTLCIKPALYTTHAIRTAVILSDEEFLFSRREEQQCSLRYMTPT